MGPAIQMSGGSAANTMAGIASLGGRAAYVGKVRNDDLGEVFSHDLRAMGVHFDTLADTDGASTARCLVLVSPDAQRTMNTYLGACANLTSSDIDPSLVQSSAIIYLEGYLFDPPAAKQAFRKAARIARDAGRKVALSLSDSFCVERHRSDFLQLISEHIDILFANEAEISALYETTDVSTAARLASKNASFVAVTLGAAGSLLLCGDDEVRVPAEPLDHLVDTTGAGDLYAAGVLFGLSRGLSLRDCGRYGSIAAGEIISHFGARPEADLSKMINAIIV
jgi:sugar/nucleoside kinase (ribokinase family)